MLQQNLCACGFLADGYLSDRPEEAAKLRAAEVQCHSVWKNLKPGVPLSHDDAAAMLSLNKEMRRIYDSTALRHVKKFDKATVPLLGWRDFLENDVADRL